MSRITVIDALSALGIEGAIVGADPATAAEFSERFRPAKNVTPPDWAAVKAKIAELEAAALPEDRQKAKADIAMLADQAATKIIGVVPEAERASWPAKEAAARAHVSGSADAGQTAMLEVEAALTGETVDVLAATIIARADAYKALAGQLTGIRRAAEAAIDAAADADAIEAAVAAARQQIETLITAATGTTR